MTLMQLSGAVVDLVYRVASLPEPGGEVVADSFAALPGGGFNAMVAARRAGMEARYGGGIGTGPFAGILRAGLAAEGIAALLPRHPADQGTCVVLVEPSGERSFVSHPGAENLATPAALAGLPATPWALLSGYALSGPGAATLAAHAAALPAPTRLVFDPAPMVASIPDRRLGAILDRADWISANRAEAREMTGAADPEAVAAALLALAPRAEGAIVRIGAGGCWLALRGAPPAHLPGFPVTPVDTNGAGDTHVGAFIAALHEGRPPPEAARFANVAAALSTLRAGPATAPARAETQARLDSMTHH